MKMQSETIVHGVRAINGEMEGTKYSSTTFHCEVDLKDNPAMNIRTLGVVTRGFKLGDASEFDKFAHLGKSMPIKCMAEFDVEAVKEVNGSGGVKLTLVSLRPLEQAKKAA